MTDGDITRLNRMYKCPDFVEEEMITREESEEKSSDSQPLNYFINDKASPHPPKLNDEEINDGVMMEDEVMK